MRIEISLSSEGRGDKVVFVDPEVSICNAEEDEVPPSPKASNFAEATSDKSAGQAAEVGMVKLSSHLSGRNSTQSSYYLPLLS